MRGGRGGREGGERGRKRERERKFIFINRFFRSIQLDYGRNFGGGGTTKLKFLNA